VRESVRSTPVGRIVVVDDSWLVLEQIRVSLSGEGYEVRTTTASDVAERLVKTADLAIIDFHMPGTDGSEVLRTLRAALPRGSACQFYLYTSDRDVAGQFATHGFDGAFLRKGDEAALLPQVNAVFRTVRMKNLADQMRKSRGDA
jgi:CheY-like chemotaxis protein